MCKVTTWRPYLADEFVQDDEQQSIDHIMMIVYVPLETGLGVDLLLGLCLVDVDFVLSSTLPEQLSFIHLCIRTTQQHTQIFF